MDTVLCEQRRKDWMSRIFEEIENKREEIQQKIE